MSPSRIVAFYRGNSALGLFGAFVLWVFLSSKVLDLPLLLCLSSFFLCFFPGTHVAVGVGWIYTAKSASVEVVVAWLDCSAGEVASFRVVAAAPAISAAAVAMSYASDACVEL